MKHLFKKVWLLLLSIGPGIFCIGYTVGTGSVTSMSKSGSQFGMDLLWVLVLSCLFAWVLMEAYGRFAVVTGGTAIHSFKINTRGGKYLAVAVMIGIIVAQWNSLTGILGLCAHALYETFRLFFGALPSENYFAILAIAIVLIIIMYSFLLVGKYSFFEKILIVFVSIMGLSFIISMFIVLPDPKEFLSGLKPGIPDLPGGKLMVAAFVGTTMAAPTFVVRPLLMRGKGWGKEDMKKQSNDALISAVLMLIINMSIMAAATGALYHEGKTIETVLDMVYTLEPMAGKFAVAVFMIGALSAGLSSVFPILMVAPLLVADYQSGELDVQSRTFKVLTAIACVFGLTVPILGANPIAAQIATQVAGVFVLPLVIGGIFVLVNSKLLMGKHKAGFWLNLGMITAFGFSLVISYTGLIALMEFFT